MLDAASRSGISCFLDNHQYSMPYRQMECMLALGATQTIECPAGHALETFTRFRAARRDWLFGHLAYDLKAETEGLPSRLPDPLNFPDLFFFEPEVLVQLSETECRIGSFKVDHDEIYRQLCSPLLPSAFQPPARLNIEQAQSREEYIDVIRRLQHHIQRGDCYEINYCTNFFARNASPDPAFLYRQLSEQSPNPFGAFYKLGERYLLCASPERFLKKQGRRILSQPIKGTWKRQLDDAGADALNRELLKASPKERSENVMVVDLVRNDLSRICSEGTVKVDELFGIYSFPQVHQMISTISGQLAADAGFAEIVRACFPMGSMTGAPKRRVVELIERYETTRRGIFSGALGYLDPDDDFDFNVVIRSILYDSRSRYLSFPVGSGITIYSRAEQEYEECLLKASAIRRILTG